MKQKPNMLSSNVCLFPSEDIQFNVTEETKKNLGILTFSLKKTQTDESIIKIVVN